MVKRIIDTNFWEDDVTVSEFTPEDKYFMIYLLTNPKSTSIGIFPFVPKMAAFELGYSVESVVGLIDRFQNKYEKILYDDDTKEIAIKNSLKFTISKGGRPIEDMVGREVKTIKSEKLIEYTLNTMSTWWNVSSRDIDLSIKNIFEADLKKRKSLYLINNNTNVNAYANAYANTDSLDESYHDTSEEVTNVDNKGFSDKNKNNDTLDESHNDTVHDTHHESLDESSKAKPNAVKFWVENVRINESSFVIQSLIHWVNDFGDEGNEILIIAMQIMLKRGADNLSYLEKILKEWIDKELKTEEEVKTYLKQRVKPKKQFQKQKHVEELPDWAKDNKPNEPVTKKVEDTNVDDIINQMREMGLLND